MLLSDTRGMLRGIGVFGAVFAALATLLPWYAYEIVLPVAGVTHVFVVPSTLWTEYSLAATLIVIGAVVALVCISLVRAMWSGVVVCLIGVGTAVYAVVRALDVPDLGVNVVPNLPVQAATTVEGGTYVAVVAGLMVMAGALPDLLPARWEPASAPAESDGPAERVPFEDGAPRTAARV
jgi:hypothetical protein